MLRIEILEMSEWERIVVINWKPIPCPGFFLAGFFTRNHLAQESLTHLHDELNIIVGCLANNFPQELLLLWFFPLEEMLNKPVSEAYLL